MGPRTDRRHRYLPGTDRLPQLQTGHKRDDIDEFEGEHHIEGALLVFPEMGRRDMAFIGRTVGINLQNCLLYTSDAADD